MSSAFFLHSMQVTGVQPASAFQGTECVRSWKRKFIGVIILKEVSLALLYYCIVTSEQ